MVKYKMCASLRGDEIPAARLSDLRAFVAADFVNYQDPKIMLYRSQFEMRNGSIKDLASAEDQLSEAIRKVCEILTGFGDIVLELVVFTTSDNQTVVVPRRVMEVIVRCGAGFETTYFRCCEPREKGA